MNQRLNGSLVARLQKFGWLPGDGVAIATKMYPTAVGPKEALAFAVYYGDESNTVVLTGQYWSEGHNVLEPHGTIIPHTSDDAELDGYVERWAIRADGVVGDSYAARLLRLGIDDSYAARRLRLGINS
jgi:hypothetical protein